MIKIIKKEKSVFRKLKEFRKLIGVKTAKDGKRERTENVRTDNARTRTRMYL